MKLGMIGLGRMGSAIAHRVVQAGHEVVGFDLNQQAVQLARKGGVRVVSLLEDVAKEARVIWLMVPAGDPVDHVIDSLLPHLDRGDIIIDGGNSKFSNSVARAQRLKKHGIFFLDCGTSGGLRGKEIGFSLMVGGDMGAYQGLKPLFEAIAAKDGFAHMGPSGAGHYVKMVHNGIEYGLLEAYAEGFHLLKEGAYKDLDLEKIARVWRHGAVIRSWLLDLADNLFEHDQKFDEIVGAVQEGGTGRWAVEEAEKQNIPVPVLKESLKVRERSREGDENYATKFIVLVRNQFGGHPVRKKGDE